MIKHSLSRIQSSLLGVALLIIVSVLAVVITQKPDQVVPTNPAAEITVAATIFPIADIARSVGGETVEVIQLLPSGASPHTYALTPQQLVALQDARVVFAVGYGLDEWGTQAATQNANVAVQTVDAGIALRQFGPADEHGGSLDPHYWLTIPNGQQIARTVAARLQELDPTNSALYASNLDSYLQTLNQAEGELQASVTAAATRKFVAIHDAWGYMAAHYGLELLATYEPIEGRTPSLADLIALQKIVAENNVTTFFTEPQKRSSSATRFLADELDLTIDILDPLGGSDEYTSYEALIRNNINAIVKPADINTT